MIHDLAMETLARMGQVRHTHDTRNFGGRLISREDHFKAIDEALKKAAKVLPREMAKRLIEHGLVDKNGKLLRPRKARKLTRTSVKRWSPKRRMPAVRRQRLQPRPRSVPQAFSLAPMGRSDMLAAVKAVTIYEAGYEGSSAPDFVSALVRNGIGCLVDIRIKPSSRKPGFSAKALRVALERVGIAYIHLVEAGNPFYPRGQKLGQAEVQRCLEQYRGHLESNQQPVKELKKLAAASTVCVMCYERDVSSCHRSVLFDLLERVRIVSLH